VDISILINTIIGIINCSKLANDIFQKLLREIEKKEPILDYKDNRDLGFRKGEIQYLNKAIAINSSDNKICAQLYALKGITFFEELTEIMMTIINKEKEAKGGEAFFYGSDSGNVILIAILENDEMQETSANALEALNCAIKLDPIQPTAWIIRNLVLFLMGNWEEAIDSIDTTLEITSLTDENIAKFLIFKAHLCAFYDIEKSLECIFEIVGMNNQDTNSYKAALILFRAIRDEIRDCNIEFN
jgi:tetratricopeptide (TPR) repeat protein